MWRVPVLSFTDGCYSLYRVTGAMRHCDITFKLNSDVEHTFTAINKDELPAIKQYLKQRNVRVKEQADDVGMRDPTKMDLGDDDDEEMSDVDEDQGKGKVKVAGDEDSGEFVESGCKGLLSCFLTNKTINPSESEDEDFAADSDDSEDGSSSADSDEESEGSVASDAMVEAAAKQAAKSTKTTSAKPTNGNAKPSTTAKSNAKSKETVDDSDDDKDVVMMDEDDQDGEAPPPKKKAKKE